VPTYEYACAECGERLEAVQKFSDDPLTVCPACGGRLRKVFSPVGIVFKGSGFYRNDSRVSANGAKDKQLNGSSSDSSTASEKSAEADKKPADSGSASSSAEAKPQKKADSGGSAKSSSTGTKVA
jgi:putative FmdB family regulatory protein